MGDRLRGPAPRSFWVIAVLSLLWNAFGCFDYAMTAARNPGYLAQFPSAMIDYIDTFPYWLMVAWALGVWGALAGSVLLLLRARQAVIAFAISLLGLATSAAYQWMVEPPAVLRTPGMMAINLVIWAAALFLLGYAWRQRKAGVLR